MSSLTEKRKVEAEAAKKKAAKKKAAAKKEIVTPGEE